MSLDRSKQQLELSNAIFEVIDVLLPVVPSPFKFPLEFYTLKEKCKQYYEARERLKKTIDLAFECEDPIALESHSMLGLLLRDLEEVDWSNISTTPLENDAFYEEKIAVIVSGCEELDMILPDLCAKHRDRIEQLAAKLLTKSRQPSSEEAPDSGADASAQTEDAWMTVQNAIKIVLSIAYYPHQDESRSGETVRKELARAVNSGRIVRDSASPPVRYLVTSVMEYANDKATELQRNDLE